jgi:hypothetical protein
MSPVRAAGRCVAALGAALLLGGTAPALPPASDSACPCLAKPVLPVALYAMEASGGWALSFLTPPCQPLLEIRVAFDGGKPIFLGHESERDPLTNHPAAQHMLVLTPDRLAVGKIEDEDDHKLTVELRRPDGRIDGPYSLLFSPRAERIAALKLQIARNPRSWVGFAEHGSVYTWLGFGWLFDARDSLLEIRYSVNDCSLAHRIIFSPKSVEPIADFRGQPDDLTFDRPLFSLLRETASSACIQVTFTDGTLSPTLELKRDPKAPPH